MRNRTTLAILSLIWLSLVANALHIQNEGITNNERYFDVNSENSTLASIDYEQQGHIAKRGKGVDSFREFDIYYEVDKGPKKFQCDQKCYYAIRAQVEIFYNGIINGLQHEVYDFEYETQFTLPDFDNPKIFIKLSAGFTDMYRAVVYSSLNVDMMVSAILPNIMERQIHPRTKNVHKRVQLEFAGKRSRSDTLINVQSLIIFTFQ